MASARPRPRKADRGDLDLGRGQVVTIANFAIVHSPNRYLEHKVRVVNGHFTARSLPAPLPPPPVVDVPPELAAPSSEAVLHNSLPSFLERVSLLRRRRAPHLLLKPVTGHGAAPDSGLACSVTPKEGARQPDGTHGRFCQPDPSTAAHLSLSLLASFVTLCGLLKVRLSAQ